MTSFRQAVDNKCRDCVHDKAAPGNWRVQTTLCAVKSCPLWPLRPQTTGAIPNSILHWYGVNPADFRPADPENEKQVA